MLVMRDYPPAAREQLAGAGADVGVELMRGLRTVLYRAVLLTSGGGIRSPGLRIGAAAPSAASSRERLRRALSILAALLDEPPARRRDVI